MKIQFDKNTVWISYNKNDSYLYIAGTVFFNEQKQTHHQLLNILNHIKDIKEFNNLILKLKGQFSFIFKNKNFSVAFTDKIRSYPICSYEFNEEFIVSNSTRHFDSIKVNFNKNQEAEEIFKTSGYTYGNTTLYDGFNILEPGNFIYYNLETKKIFKEKYFSFFNKKTLKYSSEDALKKVDDIITSSIKKLIKIADGKKIVIPLSAGLDSRLILGKLKQLGYSNIFTFTYGQKNIWERDAAEKCAKHLNIPWNFVELNKKAKQMFYTQERKDYYKFASNYNSVPHIADYYALNILKEKGVLNFENIILVNGQSGDFITGGHIPMNINKISLEAICEIFIEKHFGLWLNKLTPNFKKSIQKKIKNESKLATYFSNKELLFKEFERLECDDRQIKYVINGQRIYDWFEIDWYLPLWSDEMLDFWSTIDIKHKFGQNLFKNYCYKYNPGNAFDIKLDKKTLSLPYYLYPFLLVFKIISKIFKKKKYSRLKRTYLSFYEKYYPFYPQKSYLSYLKDAKYHRNPVSYWVKIFLAENNFKNKF